MSLLFFPTVRGLVVVVACVGARALAGGVVVVHVVAGAGALAEWLYL